MRINNNIAALNAWRNLGISSNGMGSSLEKLSSGYRINRGADDPAGLVISQKLRAQITGLTQAISNASDAVSMVQTAEGALTEMNTMLNSIRGLAVHAANTSANDASSIAADQTAVDKAVESIQRIATTTKFAGKFLLNGEATDAAITTKTGTLAAGTDGVTLALSGTLSLDTVSALLGANDSGDVNVVVTSAAVVATASGTASVTSSNLVSLGGAADLKLIGSGGASLTISFVSSTSYGLTSLAAVINSNTAATGIVASVVGSGGILKLTATSSGVAGTFQIETSGSAAAALVASLGIGTSGAVVSVMGSNMTGKLTYGSSEVSLIASGYNFTSAQSGWTGLSLALSATRATNTTSSEQATFLLDKNGEKLKFSLTPDAATADIINYGIANMQTSKLGLGAVSTDTTNYAGLNAIIAGGTYNLSDNAEAAVAIIEQAITDVSTNRSQLGSFQKFTLETTINNLGVTKENLTASESRIRDVDMAAEMMNFMKNQILVQAGTAMLAQANQVPTSVLQLLG